jgi:hypothetical protein
MEVGAAATWERAVAAAAAALAILPNQKKTVVPETQIPFPFYVL